MAGRHVQMVMPPDRLAVMPELPDIESYLQALRARTTGETLSRVRLASPFLLRSYDPPIEATTGLRVQKLSRLGKRIVIGLESDFFLVLHLMIAGRLAWKAADAKIPRRNGLAAFDFSSGTLLLTEAGSTKRASLFVVQGAAGLGAHDPGGVDVLTCDAATFHERLTASNHTLKRALTDPRLFSGIGNAYSDEILHRARLSPVTLTQRLQADHVTQLFEAARAVLVEWRDRLLAETGDGFPKKVTAFRPDMAVHGRYGKPCPACDAPIQRIVYARRETNYCARCQTKGKVLADRALSTLLKKDWPRSLEALEALRRPAGET